MSMSHGSMQAALLYGPRHIALETIPMPTLGATDVLVRIEAATTCGTDLKVFLQGGHARMITPPAVFGHEFSGTIVQVGAGVQHFREGMRVVANNSAPCYRCYYCRRNLPNLCDDLLFINGAYAEYIVVPERGGAHELARDPHGAPLRRGLLNGAAGLRVALSRPGHAASWRYRGGQRGRAERFNAGGDGGVAWSACDSLRPCSSAPGISPAIWRRCGHQLC